MSKGLTPRPAVQRMASYHPPTGGRQGKLRLDFNENTLGCSPKVIEYLKEKLTADALTMYPEYLDAMRELAAYFAVAPGELLLANGTDEAIQVLINTFLDDGDDVLLLKPTYAMYQFYADLAGAGVREVAYASEDLAFPLEEFIAAIRPSTRAILIANPNNPTGTGINVDAIRRILDAAPQAAVLIDEAYFEFCGVTALPLVRQYPNLFVSRIQGRAIHQPLFDQQRLERLHSQREVGRNCLMFVMVMMFVPVGHNRELPQPAIIPQLGGDHPAINARNFGCV